MDYNIFLFSQLFLNHVENNNTIYQDLEYDLIYPEIIICYEDYKSSSYFLLLKSEYDCIVEYLNSEVDIVPH
jgi:hypothetical protein